MSFVFFGNISETDIINDTLEIIPENEKYILGGYNFDQKNLILEKYGRFDLTPENYQNGLINVAINGSYYKKNWIEKLKQEFGVLDRKKKI